MPVMGSNRRTVVPGSSFQAGYHGIALIGSDKHVGSVIPEVQGSPC